MKIRSVLKLIKEEAIWSKYWSNQRADKISIPYLLPRLAPWGGFCSVKGCLVAADTFSEALAVLFKLKSVLFSVLLLLFEVVPKENIDDVPRLWVEACVTGCPKRLIPAMSNEHRNVNCIMQQWNFSVPIIQPTRNISFNTNYRYTLQK